MELAMGSSCMGYTALVLPALMAARTLPSILNLSKHLKKERIEHVRTNCDCMGSQQFMTQLWGC